MSPVLLSLQGVGYASPASSFVLQDLNLEIRAGEQIALIGPSGAGKSTLLHMLASALKPSQGRILWQTHNPWQLSSAHRHRLRRDLFLSPQSPPLPPRQRVVHAVLAGRLPHWSFWQAFRSLIYPSDAAAAYAALTRFSLGHKLYARVDQLSGGERQRCALARLLLADAKLMLVDEPLSALDPELAQHTLHTLQSEARARKASLICSLHQVELARANFSRIIGLAHGKIVFDSPAPSDAMLTELYRNANTIAPQPEQAAHDATTIINASRCF